MAGELGRNEIRGRITNQDILCDKKNNFNKRKEQKKFENAIIKPTSLCVNKK